jgi:hypothetical protein
MVVMTTALENTLRPVSRNIANPATLPIMTNNGLTSPSPGCRCGCEAHHQTQADLSFLIRSTSSSVVLVNEWDGSPKKKLPRLEAYGHTRLAEPAVCPSRPRPRLLPAQRPFPGIPCAAPDRPRDAPGAYRARETPGLKYAGAPTLTGVSAWSGPSCFRRPSRPSHAGRSRNAPSSCVAYPCSRTPS